MNNGYYQNPVFPGQSLNNLPNQQTVPSYEQNVMNGVVPAETSYIENILRLNRGKKATLHITVPGSQDYLDKTFTGIIEQSGRDHIIMSNPSNGEWYLVLMIYLNFVTFDEPINFIKDF